jgi:hypothetical protein
MSRHKGANKSDGINPTPETPSRIAAGTLEEWDEERLRLAKTVLEMYRLLSGVKRGGAVRNLLTDLMLLCEIEPRWGIFDDAHGQACSDFDFENWVD